MQACKKKNGFRAPFFLLLVPFRFLWQMLCTCPLPGRVTHPMSFPSCDPLSSPSPYPACFFSFLCVCLFACLVGPAPECGVAWRLNRRLFSVSQFAGLSFLVSVCAALAPLSGSFSFQLLLTVLTGFVVCLLQCGPSAAPVTSHPRGTSHRIPLRSVGPHRPLTLLSFLYTLRHFPVGCFLLRFTWGTRAPRSSRIAGTGGSLPLPDTRHMCS